MSEIGRIEWNEDEDITTANLDYFRRVIESPKED